VDQGVSDGHLIGQDLVTESDLAGTVISHARTDAQTLPLNDGHVAHGILSTQFMQQPIRVTSESSEGLMISHD
jgi:hypothetical protein